MKVLVKNKRALFNFHVEERFEAGIVLTGSEVKSLRDGGGNLVDAYVIARSGELFLVKAHISPYKPAAQFNHEPTRTRKLLMHKQQIESLSTKLQQQGYTIIPLAIVTKESRIKVELGLCRGKKLHDKRETMRKREADRAMERAIRRT